MRFHPVMLLPLALAACATPRAGDYKIAEQDRFEKTNRKIYAFNKALDNAAIKPAARVYRAVVPHPARRGVSNAFSNYGEPLNIVNAILQGKIKQAFRSLDRFIVNSTVGIGGLADVATDLGRPQEPEDFGQTLAVWGVKSGPYLVLPLFGPSTIRDGVGFAADFIADPADISRNILTDVPILARVGLVGLRLVSLRDRITEQGGDGLLADSLDEYTLVKSAYLQRRRDQIWDGNAPLEADDENFEAPTDTSGAAPETPPAAPAEAAGPAAEDASPSAPAAPPLPANPPPPPAPETTPPQ